LSSLAILIGSPVAHSLSPTIHRAAFAAAGVDWTYAALDVAAGDGAAAVEAMRVLGIGGMSVTMPHKADVAGAVDDLDPAARSLQSVNTVSWDGDRLVGSSTDGAGFVAALAEVGIDVAGARVAVIGAGGAARSVIDALGRSGTKDITVLNRSEENAERAAQLSPAASLGIVSDVTRADIVVNATSVGMGVDPRAAGPDDLACDPELLHSGQIVVDLVYHPLRTAWLAAAEELGARTVDGLGMLIHQAALQQQRWLGTLPDVQVMRAAAESALATP
jgi:shikimate dehydrogenase